MTPSLRTRTRNADMTSRFPSTLFRLFVLTVGATFAAVAVVADDDDDKEKDSKKAPKSVFEGKWINRKRGTSGPMRCELTPLEEGEWSANFEGTFQRSPFKYDVTFTGKTTGTKTDFKGTQDVDGGKYEYTSTLKGDLLSVKYRGWNGNSGDFTLKRTAKKPEPKKNPKKGSGAE